MRRALAVTLLLVLLAGCSSATSDGATSSEATRPGVAVMPYVDVTGGTVPDLAAVGQQTGQRDFVLAFALAAGGCAPAWGGAVPIDDAGVRARAAAVRDAGGRIVAATGGAQAPYLENACSTPRALADAYGRVIDAVGATALDVDVEAGVPADTVAEALATVQRDRAMPITLTLPVVDTDTALTPEAMSLLRAVASRGVDVRVNAMTMNFPPEGGWATTMVAAGDATARRLAEVWPGTDPAALRGRVGVTLMVGRNDTGPVTSLADATTVAGAARSHGFGSVGMWSVSRDNGDCPGTAKARPDCSGVDQEPFAFLRAVRGAYTA